MKPEPLKGKGRDRKVAMDDIVKNMSLVIEKLGGDNLAFDTIAKRELKDVKGQNFREEDIRSAIEWFLKELDKKRHGFIINASDVEDTIHQAFEDVMEG